MKTCLNVTLLIAILTCAAQATGHTAPDNGILPLPEYRQPRERVNLDIPDIGEYTTLKCDLHMHTVFSDGLVWPTIRVQEAWQEGLDAICITDHIEYQPHKKDIPTNHNAAFRVAREAAENANIILIKGSELTRSTPPGHYNAIFIEDASGFVENSEKGNFELDKEAIDKAAEQDAFIFWNHPGWKVDSVEGSYEWIPFVEQILKEGKLHGIEVINGFNFHRKSLDWAIEKGLTPMGTSDIHNLIAHEYDMERGVHRTMNLLFVKERTAAGIREALDAGRAVAWSTKLLAGREKWVRALYNEAVLVNKAHSQNTKGNLFAEISNNSDLYFELSLADGSLEGWPETISLNPHTTRILRVDKDAGSTAAYTVTNAFIGGYENLVVEVTVLP